MRSPGSLLLTSLLSVGLLACGGKDGSSTARCGNGTVEGGETCDDGNGVAGDGCSAACQVEAGWTCPSPGASCALIALIGNGVLDVGEGCDDANTDSGDGCSSSGQVESGFTCPTVGKPCVRLVPVCGNGQLDSGEACDDGNSSPFDGCSAVCQKDLDCRSGICVGACGDGILDEAAGEVCDDGNVVSGDGCSADCQTLEPGFTCTTVRIDAADHLYVPVVYRDFKRGDRTGGHPDFETYWCDHVTTGLVETALWHASGDPTKDSGRPRFTGAQATGNLCSATQISSAGSFDQWYQNVEGVNIPVAATLTLDRDSTASGYVYVFDSEQTHLGLTSTAYVGFFPVDPDLTTGAPQGWGLEGMEHDYGFTTEIRFPFKYQGGERLDFSGDDDLWVFIDGQLALDLGGLHTRATGTVEVDGLVSSLGLSLGTIYELAIFHAERHSYQSNFKLTLTNFVRLRTQCVPDP